jgi:hypothetical protein
MALERIIHWLKGEKPFSTYYVMFEVDGEIYTTNDLPKEMADHLATQIGGIVMPTELPNEKEV